MRTSRVSRDTSRIVAATRTLRQTRSAANEDRKARDRTLSDSELSSELSSSSDEERPVKKLRIAPIAVKQEAEEVYFVDAASPKKPKKVRRTPAKKIKGEDGSFTVQPPSNWEEMYALTRQMRNENLAPVDTMGCESLAERTRTPRDQRFQTLIALMLSSQTKDTVNAVAMKGMQDNMPGVNAHPLPPRPSFTF
jgi:endonuclease-3